MKDYNQKYKEMCDKLGITMVQAERASYGICSYCSAFNHDYGACTVDRFGCELFDDTDYNEIEEGTGIYDCNS